jgi:predicted GTPase
MIKYFQVKKRKGYSEVYYREKANSRQNKATVEQYIKTKRSILILGDGDSGKTRSMSKFYKNASTIWRKKPKPVMLGAVNPMLQWVEQESVKEYAIQKNREFSKLRQFERVDLLVEYCQEKKPVVFVDDCHKLQGRKLQIAKQCMIANTTVMTSISRNKLPPTIRAVIDRQNPQEFALSTKVAYDATQGFAWGVVVIFFMVGMPEVALLAGGFTMLANGRRGSSSA